MTIKQGDKNLAQLRQEVEAKITPKLPKLVQPQPGEKLLHELIHELRVHQIELEMQNNQLKQAQIALEESRDRYVDFYDFAPVGYLTLNHDAMIDEINLTGAALLGVERSKLTHRRFAPFVAPADSDRWHRYFMSVLKHDKKLNCELALQRGDGSHFHAMLDSLRILEKAGKETMVRIVLTDITERKQREAARH